MPWGGEGCILSLVRPTTHQLWHSIASNMKMSLLIQPQRAVSAYQSAVVPSTVIGAMALQQLRMPGA